MYCEDLRKLLKKLPKNKVKSVYLGYLWLLAGIAFQLWYWIVPGKWMVDSDMASEMVYADLLNKQGGIMPNCWFFSSEIRVLQTNWIYRLTLLFSPNNWHAARVWAALIILLIFIGAFLFFAKSIKLEEYVVWGAAAIIWPLGRWYFIYALFGGWYITYISISFIILGILFSIDSITSKVKKIVVFVLGLLLSLLAGLNGVKQLFCFFAPLLLAVVLLLLFSVYSTKAESIKDFRKNNSRLISITVTVFLFTLSNLVGFLINSKVLAKIYSFTDWNEAVLHTENPNRLYDVIKDFFFLFSNISDVELFSLSGIGAVVGIGLGLILIWSFIRLFTNFNKLILEEKLCFLLVLSTLIVCGLFFCLVGDYKAYYWLPVLPIAVSLVFVSIKNETISVKSVKGLMTIVFAAMISIVGIVTVKDEINSPLISVTREKNDYVRLTEFLEENGYTQGYASFWSANVLTEMSSGKIEMWTLRSVQDSFVIYEFLQRKDHLTRRPDGKCFLIFNELYDGPSEWSVFINYADCKEIYSENTFSVWLFDSADDLEEAFRLANAQ